MRLFPLIAAVTLFSGTLSYAEVPITLDEAVTTAVEKNLDLKVESFNPAISGTDIRRATAIYNPRLNALFDHRGENSQIDPFSFAVNRQRSFDANFGADVLLATGATASAAFNNLFSRDNLDTPLSKFAQPRFTLSFSQPLLQGFGKEVTERNITVAKDARESALWQYRLTAIATAAAVRDEYYTLLKARENLETRKASLAVAREIHAGNQARVKAGVLAAVELLDSELGVAQREKDLLDAEKTVHDEADKLRVLVQYPAPGPVDDPSYELVPSSPPAAEPIEHSEVPAVQAALANRPELTRARIALRTQEFQANVARNAVLPSLALTGSAGLTGLGTDYGHALDDLASGRFPSWSAGIVFAFPLGNDAAEADLQANRLRARQGEAQIRSLEESIALEVRSAIRNVTTRFAQIAVAEKGVRLADARLASFIKRGKVGLAVTKDILQAEADLTAAREGLAAARADYQAGITQFFRSTGELLDRHGIRIPDAAIENLAWKESPR